MLRQEDIKTWIEKEGLITRGDRILVGFSGGSDSGALAHILLTLGREMGFYVELVYIQHHLRGQESQAEEAFVSNWAQTYACPLTIIGVEVLKTASQEKVSIETAARQLRHRAFRQKLETDGFDKIALGHHAQDQAETILMHFLRGSGVVGLGGMKRVDSLYIRPLLTYSKAEIRSYLRHEQVAWWQDSSNLDLVYRRNRVRLDLLPYLQAHFNPNIINGLVAAGKQMQDLQEYLWPQIEEAFLKARISGATRGQAQPPVGLVLDSLYLEGLPPYLQQMVISRAIAEVKGSPVNIEGVHIRRAVSLLSKAHGKKEDLMQAWQVRKSYNNLIFEKKAENVGQKPENIGKKGDLAWELGLDRRQGKRYIKIIKDFILLGKIFKENIGRNSHKKNTEIFDYEKLPANLVLRYPRPEDYIRINAQGNKKKLKDFMVDQKIPKESRLTLPVLAGGHEIIWLIGYRIGYPYRSSAQTKQFFRLTILGRTGKCQKLKREYQKQK